MRYAAETVIYSCLSINVTHFFIIIIVIVIIVLGMRQLAAEIVIYSCYPIT